MKNYVCQTMSTSGRILESFYENFFDALSDCMNSSEENHNLSARVFDFAEDPNMENPLVVARTIK